MSDSVSVQLRLEDVCARFEEAWQAAGTNGVPPRVEDYLGATPAPERAALLREIILLDLHYRRGRGERPVAADYEARCPGDVPAIRAAFAELPTAADVATVRAGRAETMTDPGATAPDAAVTDADFPAIPGYEVLGELGEGGMGKVYRARQLALKRAVALKVIRSGGLASPEELARFRSEAQALARLQHPNIVPVYEVGEHGGQSYFSMEFCASGSLEARLRQSLPGPGEAARFVETLARAMHAVHERSVVHRDLKPANVLLAADGTPKVADFGLAKRLDDDAGQTQTGRIMGTPSYMAPEQAGGRVKDVGPAADVYALGAILYECLTGRPPFRAATVLETLNQVRQDDPVPPRNLNPAAPRDLETVCLKCLQKEPSRRYLSAAEMADDLRRYQSGEPIRARRASLVERAAKWVRRKPMAAALSVALLAAVALGVALLVYREVNQREETERQRKEKERAERQSELDQIAAKNLAGEVERATKAETAAKNSAADATEKGRLVAEEFQRFRSSAVSGNLLEIRALYRHDAAGTLERLEDPTAFPFDLRDFTWGLYYRWCRRERLRFPGVAQLMEDGRTLLVMDVLHLPGGRTRYVDAATGKEVAPPGPKKPGEDKPLPPDALPGGEASPVAVTADGRLRAILHGRTVRLSSGETLEATAENVEGLAFSADGKNLVAWGRKVEDPTALPASERGQLTLWALPGGKKLAALETPGRLDNVALAPDGSRLAVAVSEPPQMGQASWTNSVRLWDAGTGGGLARLATATLSSRFVRAMQFTPDAKSLTIVNSDGALMVWDTLARKEVRRIQAQAEVRCLAFLPDGKTLYLAWDDEITCWAPAEGRRLFAIGEGAASLALSADGKLLATAGSARGLRLWNAETGKPLDTLDATGTYASVCLPRDGRVLVASRAAPPTSLTETIVWDLFPDEPSGVLGGHGHLASSIAFSPLGNELATGSYDRAVKVWNLDEPGGPVTLAGHAGAVSSVAYRRDGRVLASASLDGEVKLWDRGTGKELFALRGHAGRVRSVAFLGDGALLVSGGEDEVVRLWDAAAGKEVSALRGHRGEIYAVAASPDGKVLVSAGDDRTVRVWDPATGKELHNLTGHGREICALAFSPDGKLLASGSGERNGAEEWSGEVILWDTATWKRAHSLRCHAGFVRALAFSPDGKTLATGSDDRTVTLWDPVSGRQRGTIAGRGGAVRGLAFDRRSEVLAAAGGRQGEDGSWIGEVNLWGGARPERIRFRPHTGGLSALAVSADGKSLVTAGAALSRDRARRGPAPAAEVRSWELATGKAGASFRLPDRSRLAPPNHLALSANGATVALLDWGDHLVRVWGPGGQEHPALKWDEQVGPACVAVSPDGKLVALGGNLFPAAERRPELKPPPAPEPRPFEVKPLPTAVEPPAPPKAVVRVWEVATGKEAATLVWEDEFLHALAFAPDGKTLAASTDRRAPNVPFGPGRITLWDVPSATQQKTLEHPGMAVGCLAFAPDGRSLAAATPGLEVWELATEKPQALGEKAAEIVVAVSPQSLAFDPDGKTLAHAAEDGVRVWDLSKGRPMMTMPGVAPVAFVDQGRALAAGTPEGQLALWELPPAARPQMPRAPAVQRQGDLAAGQPGPPTESEMQIGKWLRERHDLLVRAAKGLEQRFMGGAQTGDEVTRISEELLRAELALAAGPAERLAAHERYLKSMRAVREDALSRSAAGTKDFTPADVCAADGAALRAEVALLRSAQVPGDPPSPEIRSLLKMWREVLLEEVAILELRARGGVLVMADVLETRSASILEADLVLATKPAERLAAYEAHLARLREAEDLIRERVEAGVRAYRPADLLGAKAARLEAEVLLAQAAGPSPERAAKIRALRKQEVEALRQQGEILEPRARNGLGDSPRFCWHQLLQAELALAEKPADCVAACQAYRDRLVEWERFTREMVEQGIRSFTPGVAFKARAARLEADVHLLKAKAAVKE
jgi:WD40 repeat protein